MQLPIHVALECVCWRYKCLCWTVLTGNVYRQNQVTVMSLGGITNLGPWCPALSLSSLTPVKKQSSLSVSDGLSLQAIYKREKALKSGKLFSASKAIWDLWGEHPNNLVSILEMKARKEIFTKIYRSLVILGKESSSSHSCDRLYLQCYFPLPKCEVQLN